MPLTFGCGPEEAGTSSIRPQITGNFGEILLSYEQTTLDRAGDGDSSFQVSARFLSVRDTERHEVRYLWSEELPLVEFPYGNCNFVESVQTRQEHASEGSVELLDAGELTLRVGEDELRVSSWIFPTIHNYMAGMFYGDEALEADYQPESEYRLLASGSEEIESFEVGLVSPEEFDALTVAGSEVGVEPVTLPSQRQPLEVRWEPGRSTNEILVEFSFNQYGSERRIVCRSHEDGIVEIPLSLSGGFWEPEISDGRLAIYRIARSSFETEGLDGVEVLFVVYAVIPLAVP